MQNMRKRYKMRRYETERFIVFRGQIVRFDWNPNIGNNPNPAFYRFHENPSRWIPLNKAGAQYLATQTK